MRARELKRVLRDGSLCGCVRSLGMVFVLWLAASTADAQTTIEWNNPAGGDWGTATNWDPQNVPDNSGEEVVFPVGGGTYTANLNGSFTVARVLIDNPDATLDLHNQQVSCALDDGIRNAGTLLAPWNYSYYQDFLENLAGGRLRIPGGGVFYYDCDSLRNAGEIRIGTAGGGGEAYLYVSNHTVRLLGDGQCVLESGGTPARARILPNYGGFAQDAGHTIRGSGLIQAGFTNYGTIAADVPGEELWVHSYARTNEGLMKASDGGILVIGDQVTSQGLGGVIRADGGTVLLSNASQISGGTLETAGGGVIRGAAVSYLNSFTNEGDIELMGGAGSYWSGTTTTNNGRVKINADQSETDCVLYCYNSTVTIDGSGEFLLQTAGSPSDALLAGYYGSMIQGASHTIRGEGNISTGLENYGTVSADVSGRTLLLDGAGKTNYGLMRAINGGTLQIHSTTVSQDAGGTLLADGGTVLLSNASQISGGTLETAGGGVIRGTAASYLNSFTNEGDIELMGGAGSYWSGTTTTNNGRVKINADQSETDCILYCYNSTVTIDGSGEFLLQTAGSPSDALLAGYYGSMIQGASHTIRGEGNISTGLENYGTVSADVSGRTLLLDGADKTNYGLMRAINGGTLQIHSTTVSQDAGGMLFADGGTVLLTANGQVTGGHLNSANGGSIDCASGNAAFLGSVTNDGTVRALSGSVIYCWGETFTNDGTVLINPEQSSTDTYFNAYNGTVNIAGGGEIRLQTAGDPSDAQLASLYGQFRQGPDHLIHGDGNISAYLTNNGTVRADVPGRQLYLSGGQVNNALLEAVDGAMLRVTTGAFWNHGRAVARDGGELRADALDQHYNYWAGRILSGGCWEVHDNSTMRLMNVDPLRLAADVYLSGPNSMFVRDDAGSLLLEHLSQIDEPGRLTLDAGRNLTAEAGLTNAGYLAAGAGCTVQVPGVFLQTGNNPSEGRHDGQGWTIVDGMLTSPDPLVFTGGTLAGAGIVAGNVESMARCSPGWGEAGTLTIQGDFMQSEGGEFFVQLGSPAAGEHDLLVVSGHANLTGRIWVTGLEGFTISPDDTFTVMTCGSRTGEFTEFYGCPGLGLQYQVLYEGNEVKIAVYGDPSAVEEPAEPAQPEELAGDDEALEHGDALAGGLPADVGLYARVLPGAASLGLELPAAADVTIEVFDPAGRRVAHVHDHSMSAGRHELALRSIPGGGTLAAGVYLARASVRDVEGTAVRSTRFVLIR